MKACSTGSINILRSIAEKAGTSETLAPVGDITLFDFDFCGNGWLCLDIAYYILQLHNTEKNESERIEKIASFYKGYETIQKISAEEMRLIPTLGVCLYYFYLGIQCKRFNNWSNVFLNEAYLKRYITVLIKGYYETTRSAINLE